MKVKDIVAIMPQGESRLYELAEGQAGHFSAAQARAAGVSRQLLHYFERTGTVQRAARGVYRLTRFPRQPFEDLVVACLWAGSGAVVSHQSALAVHGLGDAADGEVHVTLERLFRGRRAGVVIHRAEVDDEDWTVQAAVPVTTLDRTLGDLAEGPYRSVTNRAGPEAPPARVELRSDAVASDDSFVGRHQDLRDLGQALRTSQLVTLAGPPGVGKSRLATELLARETSRYSDGVFMAELAAITDATLVPRVVADAVSVWEQPGRLISDTLAEYLATRRVLLVLDNCEHLLRACADLVEHLIAACPEISVIATSQVPLGVACEDVRAIPPLPVPEPGTELGSGTTNEAVRLFCDRAATSRRGFRLDATNAATVAEICRRLDGIPLAIELAAARVGVLTPADIAARLDDRLTLLSDVGTRRVLHHQTLRATLEWSHNLLPAAEKVLLRRLAVFAGGCTLPAIEAVCAEGGGGESGRDGHALLDPLAALVSKSLVIADTAGRHARYRLLESIRLFAADQVGGAGEREVLRRRHAAWFLAVAEDAEPALTGPQQLDWLDALIADHDNFRAALSWAVEGAHGAQALRLAGSLALFWRVKGHFVEGRDWVQAALPLAGGEPAIRAKALWGMALLSVMLGDLAAAIESGEEGLDLARTVGDTSTQARHLLVLANARQQTEPKLALGLFETALEMAREVGDSWCLAHALGLIGRTRLEEGNPAAAQAALQEALEVARAANDAQSLRLVLWVLGDLAANQGEGSKAEILFSEDLEIARRLGEPYAVAAALCSLGDLAHDRGEMNRAAGLLREALAVSHQAGAPDLIAGASLSLAWVALGAGDVKGARHFVDEAIAIAGRGGRDLGRLLNAMGHVALAEGNVEGSRSAFNEALAIARANGRNGMTASVLTALAHMNTKEGDPRQGALRHLEALEIRHRMGLSHQFESLDALAAIAVNLNRPDFAARLLGAAEALRRRQDQKRRPRAEEEYEKAVAAVDEALGSERSTELKASGAALSLPATISYARRGFGGRRARFGMGWDSLTTAELEVSRLAAEGMSNAQIADRLFISPRTVGAHLSRIFAKLNIKSRTQLAALAMSEAATKGSAPGEAE